jgi:hypothetical protein
MVASYVQQRFCLTLCEANYHGASRTAEMCKVVVCASAKLHTLCVPTSIVPLYG